MATGQVLFQRFFCRKSMRDFNVRRMACACLFLATKLEESHKRTRDILMVFDRINKRRDGSKSVPLLIPETKEYDIMKERVITYERILLKTFGFIIHAVHPHKYVNSFVHSLEGSDELQQLAWNMLNDSLRTTLCVRFKGHVVAAGAIYLAARRLQAPLPQNPPWWEAFKVPTDQLVEVVLALHLLYQRPKAHYIEVNPDVLKQQQAVSVVGQLKQLTPGLDPNDSPAAQDSSVIRGGPDLASQQQGAPQAPPAMATTTAAPMDGPAEMLAAAVAAAQQRLRVGAIATGTAAVTAAAPRPDADVVSAVNQAANGPSPMPNGGGAQANGGGATTSGVEGGAVQSRKRSRSQERGKKESRSPSGGSSRSRSRSQGRSKDRDQDRDADRDRARRSRSRDRDRQRDGQAREGSRRDRRSRSRSRSRERRERDRRDRRDGRDRDRDYERERRDYDRGDRGKERDRERDRDRERERERERDRDRERERPRDDRPSERDARAAGANKDEGRDRKEGGLPPPPPLPPRHPDRNRR